MILYKNIFKSAVAAALCIFSCSIVFAQDLPKELYQASAIPDSLKENANSIIRYAIEEDVVSGPGKMSSKYHRIITILNEKADHEAVLDLYYNKKFDSYSSIVMRVYDANGNVIKKYHKSDMEDYAAMDDVSLVQDGRILYLKHTVASYPETIEIEYESSTSSFFDLGGWNIQADQQAVQNSYYHLTVDSNAGFRYLNKNTDIKPIKKAINEKDDYYWEVKNLKAIKLEEKAEGWRVFPHIYFAQNKFNQEGYPGELSSWNSYGKWQKDLNADVCSLSPEREAEIRKMTDTIKTDKEKAKFLYRYMQQNMRYVSVQLGIGGWKPFAATFVDQKKYGDCKALSNYMSALLKAVGIKSCYAVINCFANQEPADPKFPYDMFNHVILCVPFKSDTTWLECTSPYSQFGKLGSFTENRRALIVTEDGGKLVNTPKSTMEDNQFNSQVHIAIDADGGAKATVKIVSTGTYRDEFLGFSTGKLDDEKKGMMEWLNIKQPISFDIDPAKDANGTRETSINLEYDKFSDIIAGDKQFYHSNVFDLINFTVPVEEHRKSDYYFETPMQKTCAVTIDLPAGFTVETLPVSQSLKFTYGNYDVKYTYDATKNQVISTAKFVLTNHVIPAAKYTEMQEYLDAVAKAQNKKLVIRRKA